MADKQLFDWQVSPKYDPGRNIAVKAAYYSSNPESALVEFKDLDNRVVFAIAADTVALIGRVDAQAPLTGESP